MTAQGPQVLEFNARLGDPETQVLMHRMQSDFVPHCGPPRTARSEASELEWRGEPSVCVVLAAAGYPGTVRSGDAITGVDAVDASDGVSGRNKNRSKCSTDLWWPGVGRDCRWPRPEIGDPHHIRRGGEDSLRRYAIPARYRTERLEALVESSCVHPGDVAPAACSVRSFLVDKK